MEGRFKFGVVKFFRKDEGWGVITPDGEDSASRGVYFRTEDGCLLHEDFLGDIEMNFDTLAPGYPEAGDEVLYSETPPTYARSNGRSAFAWSYMGYYRRASRIIEARGDNKLDPRCRVSHCPSGTKPAIVFTGNWSELTSLEGFAISLKAGIDIFALDERNNDWKDAG